MCFFNFINKCFIIWLIIHNITIAKVWPYKHLINCNKSLSWKFIGQVSEEGQSLYKPCWVSLLCEYCNWVFHQDTSQYAFNPDPRMQYASQDTSQYPNSLGDWYIIEIYGRMLFFCTFPWKNHLLCLFWGIWVKRYFPYVGPITNCIEINVKLLCWIILILNNWKEWCVMSKKLHYGWGFISQIIYVN